MLRMHLAVDDFYPSLKQLWSKFSKDDFDALSREHRLTKKRLSDENTVNAANQTTFIKSLALCA